jgi:hypothetical protein
MAGADDDFDDFLKRRKPVFRAPDDMFEPPAELDRVVLRHAREAIESDRTLRVYRGPRWAAPVALAATLVLAFTVLFYAGLPQKQSPQPEVVVQNVAERVDIPRTEAVVANNQRTVVESSDAASDRMMVDIDSPMAPREAAAGAVSPAASPATPSWRRDSKTWLAEIERLRSAGDTARAEAELAEYKRQQRAYAGAPDR